MPMFCISLLFQFTVFITKKIINYKIIRNIDEQTFGMKKNTYKNYLIHRPKIYLKISKIWHNLNVFYLHLS